MKKNLLTLLIILLSVLCGSSNLSAQENETESGTWGGIDWTLTTDGTLTIKPTAGDPVGTGYKNQPFTKGQWREAVVYNSSGGASAIGGYPAPWMDNGELTKVKKLIIEEGVTSIGSFTAKFPNLTGEVVIPSTVTYIGQEAFQGAPITKLTFAPGGTEKLCIGPGAFKSLAIVELELPCDRPEIHLHCWTFQGCSKLEYVYIPANVNFSDKKYYGWTHVEYNGMDNFYGSNHSNNYASNIFASCPKLETIVFDSDEVRTKFLSAQGNKSTINSIGATIKIQGPTVALWCSNIKIHEITLSWDNIGGVSGYNVYKGDNIVASSITENSFTINNLEGNTNYCFSVTAIIDSKESEPTEICEKTLKAVAKVGSTEYATIDEAIAAWTNNTTLTLLANVTLSNVIQLLSTESHYLDLSEYTMTAASKQHAIEIICKDRETEGNCLTINATSGGITASGKSCIYYKNPNTTKDRPGINIYGGEFNGSYSISCTTQQRGTNNPRFTIYGGTFNASISINYGILDTRGGYFNCSVSCSGDKSSYRQIAGGTFKSGITGTIEETKFWIGTAKDTYNVGVYVDENGYLVVGGPVIIGYKNNQIFNEDYNCYTETYKWSTSNLQYSSAKAEGLYYNSIKRALSDNNSTTGIVLVHQGTLDLTAETKAYSYSGTIKLPKEDSEFTVIFKTTPSLTVKTDITDRKVVYSQETVNGITTRVYRLCTQNPCNHVARIGGTHYESISEAYNFAQEGETINIINTPTAGEDLFYEVNEINKNVTIDFGAYTYAITVAEGRSLSLGNCTLKLNDNVITNNGTLNLNNVTLIGSGSNIVLKGKGTTTISYTCKITNGKLEYYGGELFNESPNIPAVAKKDFAGIGNVVGKNWSTISTPIANAAIPEATAGTHDLYRYNEEKELWEYFNDDEDQSQGGVSNPFDKLELGRGYLYANAKDITLELEGNLNSSSIGPISLNYTEGNKFAGFDFIGNPFTHTITRSNIKASPSQALSTGFYVVGANGTWIAKTDSNDKIAPMESVLIKANGPGDLIIHSNNGSKRAARNEDSYISVNVASKTHSDVTHISFNEGMGLDKISHRNPDNPMIYIPVEGKNYAIAMMSQDVKEVPVYFNANRMAEYTISIEQKNCEFNTMTLVDKLTGIETNMLIEDYSFMARTFDDANRFIIRLSIEDNSDSESENFAFISNGQMIIEEIEGQGVVRIFDVMGRHIAQHSVSGSASIATDGLATGMYIIQMADDNGVKVQKIIID